MKDTPAHSPSRLPKHLMLTLYCALAALFLSAQAVSAVHDLHHPLGSDSELCASCSMGSNLSAAACDTAPLIEAANEFLSLSPLLATPDLANHVSGTSARSPPQIL